MLLSRKVRPGQTHMGHICWHGARTRTKERQHRNGVGLGQVMVMLLEEVGLFRQQLGLLGQNLRLLWQQLRLLGLVGQHRLRNGGSWNGCLRCRSDGGCWGDCEGWAAVDARCGACMAQQTIM